MGKNNKGGRQLLKSRKEELLVLNNPKSPVAEAFRQIRTNLSFISPDEPLQTVLFTSSAPSEGKSSILANLAVSMVQNGNKVIIIDADLRKPMQHKFFEMTNFNGLSNVLSGEIDFATGLRETGIDGLKLISAGSIPPNPAELLASRKMEEILAKARAEADLVFIDTPPVVAVTDAAVLASKVDGTLLIVASHQTEQEILKKAKELLVNARANILGVILNKYPVHQLNRYHYYHYYG